MLETVAVAILAYVGTNIDDIFLDTILFSQVQNASQRRGLYLGQQIGVGTLALVSLLSAWGLNAVSPKLVGLIGFVPIIMGIKALFDYIKNRQDSDDEDAPATAGKNSFLITMATLTISGGADNLGLYIPLFAGMSGLQIVATFATFSAMSFVWCAIAQTIAGMPWLKNLMQKYNKILMPLILIGLGVYVLVKSGVIF